MSRSQLRQMHLPGEDAAVPIAIVGQQRTPLVQTGEPFDVEAVADGVDAGWGADDENADGVAIGAGVRVDG